MEDGFEEVQNLVIFDRKIRVESPEEKRQHFYILYEIKTGGLKSKVNILKLNYRKKVFYFALNILPWEFLLIKKLDFEKTKAT